MQSISFSRRENTEAERGFALLSALVIAFLYFGLMQLLLIDASRSLHEAQRFRARIVAKTLAENGAELAAINMMNQASGEGEVNDAQGHASGKRTSGTTNEFNITPFTIESEGTTVGVVRQHATVTLEGYTDGATVHIEQSRHSQ